MTCAYFQADRTHKDDFNFTKGDLSVKRSWCRGYSCMTNKGIRALEYSGISNISYYTGYLENKNPENKLPNRFWRMPSSLPPHFSFFSPFLLRLHLFQCALSQIVQFCISTVSLWHSARGMLANTRHICCHTANWHLSLYGDTVVLESKFCLWQVFLNIRF